MQLAPIDHVAPIAPVAPTASPTAPAAPATGYPGGFGTSRVPWNIAPTSAPAPVAGAVDGATRITAAPIVDFPGIAAGDVFDIVKGSKVGPIGVRGEAEILRFDPDHATFHVDAGAFGMSVDVIVDIVQVDDEHVRISSTGTGLPDMSELGRIVESRTNYAVFEQVSDPTKLTKLVSDGNGNLVIDTVVPKLGAAHVVLERR